VESGKKGFSVNSMYKKKMEDQVLIPYKFLCKSKLPQRIKIFFWLVVRNKILTKDNLKKRNWNGSLDSVGLMNLSIICSFIAPLRSIYGE
jgi:hypothetical protein